MQRAAGVPAPDPDTTEITIGYTGRCRLGPEWRRSIQEEVPGNVVQELDKPLCCGSRPTDPVGGRPLLGIDENRRPMKWDEACRRENPFFHALARSSGDAIWRHYRGGSSGSSSTASEETRATSRASTSGTSTPIQTSLYTHPVLVGYIKARATPTCSRNHIAHTYGHAHLHFEREGIQFPINEILPDFARVWTAAEETSAPPLPGAGRGRNALRNQETDATIYDTEQRLQNVNTPNIA